MVFITKVFLPVAIFLFFRIINSNFRRLTRKVFIIGDSMIKKVDGYLLTNSIKHKYLVKVRPFLAAKTVDMFDYVKPIQRDFDPDAYILHIGTDDLTADKKPDEIGSEIS